MSEEETCVAALKGGRRRMAIHSEADARLKQRKAVGKTVKITHKGTDIFQGLPSPYTAIRYNSLTIDPDSLPDCLEVTATADDGDIMGVRHKTLPVFGVQYHPESVLSEHGHAMLRNFLQYRA